MTKLKEMPFRLALRQEDEWWRAYLAHAGTMEGAMCIGSILMTVVKASPKHKQAFIDLMKAVLADAIKDFAGIEPVFKTRDAPDNERKQ